MRGATVVAAALLAAAPASALERCRATDGDSLNCGGERVRLVEPQAPERGWRARCPRERELAERATQSLAALVQDGVRLERKGRDYWRRTKATAWNAEGVNVGEAQIASGDAVRYRPRQALPWCRPGAAP